MQRGARFAFLQHANNAQKRLKIKVWDVLHLAGALPCSVALVQWFTKCFPCSVALVLRFCLGPVGRIWWVDPVCLDLLVWLDLVCLMPSVWIRSV